MRAKLQATAEELLTVAIDDTIHHCLKIPDQENYLASSLGEIISLASGEPKVLKPYTLKNGYDTVCLQGKTTYVHRLVAQAFYQQIDPARSQVNHLDGCPQNNKVTNLEWVTPAENIEHAVTILKEIRANAQ